MNKFGIVHNYFGTDFIASPEEYCNRISRAAAIGFDLLTVQQDVPFLFSKDNKQKLLDAAKKCGLRLSPVLGPVCALSSPCVRLVLALALSLSLSPVLGPVYALSSPCLCLGFSLSLKP